MNLTDGLDGLAAGSATFCFACLAIIGYWQYRHFNIYHVGDALDLALAAVAWPAPASASCGGTPLRPRSSWATPARCRSARAWPRCAC